MGRGLVTPMGVLALLMAVLMGVMLLEPKLTTELHQLVDVARS